MQGPVSHNSTGNFLTISRQFNVVNKTEADSNGSAASSAHSALGGVAANVNACDDTETTVSCKKPVNRVSDDLTFLEHQLEVLRWELKDYGDLVGNQQVLLPGWRRKFTFYSGRIARASRCQGLVLHHTLFLQGCL